MSNWAARHNNDPDGQGCAQGMLIGVAILVVFGLLFWAGLKIAGIT